jgi:hypothetical protein
MNTESYWTDFVESDVMQDREGDDIEADITKMFYKYGMWNWILFVSFGWLWYYSFEPSGSAIREFVDYIYLPFRYSYFLTDLSHLETVAASGRLVGERLL